MSPHLGPVIRHEAQHKEAEPVGALPQGQRVRRDPKWEAFRDVIKGPKLRAAKLIIFTESKETAEYLVQRISGTTAILHPKSMFSDLPQVGHAVRIAYYNENVAVREIAARFGQSEKSIESLLYRARVEFRQKYDLRTKEIVAPVLLKSPPAIDLATHAADSLPF